MNSYEARERIFISTPYKEDLVILDYSPNGSWQENTKDRMEDALLKFLTTQEPTDIYGIERQHFGNQGSRITIYYRTTNPKGTST